MTSKKVITDGTFYNISKALIERRQFLTGSINYERYGYMGEHFPYHPGEYPDLQINW